MTDVESYLPNDLLVKMDIAAMAVSLETRSPFLDHRVLEFCARLPARLKLRGVTMKYLARRTAAGLLPAGLVKRRKMGFGVPVGAWLRGDLAPWLQDVLLSSRALGRDYFRPEALRALVGEHIAGRRDHAPQLWALLWLELWHRELVD